MEFNLVLRVVANFLVALSFFATFIVEFGFSCASRCVTYGENALKTLLINLEVRMCLIKIAGLPAFFNLLTLESSWLILHYPHTTVPSMSKGHAERDL